MVHHQRAPGSFGIRTADRVPRFTFVNRSSPPNFFRGWRILPTATPTPDQLRLEGDYLCVATSLACA
jgi:hypothetical protein